MVFEPMVPGDELASAQAEAARYDDARVTCFWDEQQSTALEWTVQYHLPRAPELLAALPPDNPWRPLIEEFARESRPMWDVAYFFPPGGHWPSDALPEPATWTMQVDFGYGEDGQAWGAFWRDTSTAWPEPSAWKDEFVRGMSQVGAGGGG